MVKSNKTPHVARSRAYLSSVLGLHLYIFFFFNNRKIFFQLKNNKSHFEIQTRKEKPNQPASFTLFFFFLSKKHRDGLQRRKPARSKFTSYVTFICPSSNA